jgi:hypothetical protein
MTPRMISNDSLFIWAKALGIEVCYKRLHPELYGMADAANKIITLDNQLINEPREQKCILAEEIGHILYPPRPGHIAYHSRQFWELNYYDCSNIRTLVAQDERKALLWATDVLIPDVEFNRILGNGLTTIPELMECFEVTRWFTLLKIAYYRQKERNAGRRVKWRDVVRRERGR